MFLKVARFPPGKLNFDMKGALSGADIMGVNHPHTSRGAGAGIVCISKQPITYRDVASKPIMKLLVGVGAHMGPLHIPSGADLRA